ncbi:magnetochrome domain-containing protein [Candidatus Poribacteria bacterium]
MMIDNEDNDGQNDQKLRRFLPAILSKRRSADSSSKPTDPYCSLKQWIMVAVVLSFFVLVLWAMLSGGTSQGGEASRSGSSVRSGSSTGKRAAGIGSYQRTPSISSPIGRTLFMEGHWLGMEVGPLTARLASNLAIPPSVRGVLVDEVTLISADQGMLAGDVVVSVAGQDTPDLSQFLEASKKVRSSKEVIINVFRRGKHLSIHIKSNSELGFAQMESAPMIRPTDTSPHRYYGPCTNCHSIGNTGQLSADLGDTIRRPLPSVRSGTPAPHRNYGKCARCHKTLDSIFKGHNQIGAPGGI